MICLVVGAVAELASAAVWIPCDIIQQKLMVQGPLASHRSYSGNFGFYYSLNFFFFHLLMAESRCCQENMEK